MQSFMLIVATHINRTAAGSARWVEPQGRSLTDHAIVAQVPFRDSNPRGYPRLTKGIYTTKFTQLSYLPCLNGLAAFTLPPVRFGFRP